MKTDSEQPPFWMLEDVELRCKMAADILDRATVLSSRLLSELAVPGDREQFQRIQQDVDTFRRVARSYALHLRETNLAQMLRQDLAEGRPMTTSLLKEFGQLLEADVANQNGAGRVLEMQRLYRESPPDFFRRYLLPATASPAEKGEFTLTTR